MREVWKHIREQWSNYNKDAHPEDYIPYNEWLSEQSSWGFEFQGYKIVEDYGEFKLEKV
jgi:hypothetical protein